ncbi:acetate uptake transporter [Aneurinibacillus sp. Ricciae_BoGa-3]|uniref:acetate uptake transporter n=1 Tax=Aneurinibacillus sp. Ricciae_BoGa-3 TaxID=3022697 RepID=UPI00234144B8|nr:acetate uptake transporter [Aneurinibacillus sp. Ricciae_BoGa-3]WCK55217.1 acetate uptake transporter [Aneurinibacillus sp. Ricciae_BoGa-3]
MIEKKVSIADPGPLGLAAFALTTFVLSCVNAHLVPPSIAAVFLTAGLFYGGLAQLLAGMWEFRKGNTFAATAFTSYGAFWVSLSSMVYFELTGVLKFGTDANIATGLFLVAWTIFTFYMWIGTFRLNRILNITFSLLLITFILLDLTEFKIISGPIAGYFGIATAFAAWYGSAAGILNPLFNQDILPVGEFKANRESLQKTA